MDPSSPESKAIFRKQMNSFNQIYENYPMVYKKINNDGNVDRIFSFVNEIMTLELSFAFKSNVKSP